MIRRIPMVAVPVIVLGLSGCGVPYATLNEVARRNAAAVETLEAGLSEEAVHERMGRGLYRYQVHPLDSGVYRRPIKTERFTDRAGDTVTVLWYHGAPGYITAEPTLPVVLKNGELVGWGQSTFARYRSPSRE